MRPLAITIVQGAFLPVPPVAGGAVEKLWFDLGREFARRGLVVTHISRQWPGLPREDLIDGVAHRRIEGFDFPRSGVLSKLMDLAYSLRCLTNVGRADITVTNTFFLPLLIRLLKRRRGVVYVSVHRYPRGQMFLYRAADRLQCVSTAVADAVRSQSPSVASLVKVVPNYVPSCLSEPQVREGWSTRRREVLFVGRVHPEKGVELLLRAFARLPAAVQAQWSLRLVGPYETASGGGGTAYLQAMQAIARSLNLAVDFSGPIFDRSELDAAYRRARVFVYPSVAPKGEAFPLAPLEAMARGCAVITSGLACFSDFIEPGVNADTFELPVDSTPESATAEAVPALEQALCVLLSDEARQRSNSLNGLKTAQRFTLERVADAFLDDFRQLVVSR